MRDRDRHSGDPFLVPPQDQDQNRRAGDERPLVGFADSGNLGLVDGGHFQLQRVRCPHGSLYHIAPRDTNQLRCRHKVRQSEVRLGQNGNLLCLAPRVHRAAPVND